MSNKIQKKITTQVWVFVSIFSVAAVILLIIVRAATASISIQGGASLAGPVAYKTDDTQSNGDYLEFGQTTELPETGTLPAYPPVPTANGTTIVEVSSHAGLRAAVDNPSVREIILNDGNYQPGTDYFRIQSVKNKKLIAKNRYGAEFAYAAQTGGDQGGRMNLLMVRNDGIEIRGIKFRNAGGYAISMGAYNFGPSGANYNMTISHSMIQDTGQSGIAVDSGFGSQCNPDGQGGPSRNITLEYNVIKNLGMRFGNISFGEGIYTSSGGNCQDKDGVDGIVIRGNIFDGTGQRGAGEAIGLKTHTYNALVENNYIKNWPIGESTDGGAISAWIDKGLPASKRTTTSSGTNGIVIRGNVVDGAHAVQRYVKGNGIAVGHAAVIENNTIRNSQHAGILIVHGGNRSQGFANPQETTVIIKGNKFENNGLGSFYIDSNPPFPFTVNINATGNSGDVSFPDKAGINWVSKN